MKKKPKKDIKKRTATQWTARLDKLFSKAVISRGFCERCKRYKDVQLQTSHIYSRSYKELRWDLLNALCLCAGCHFWWHKNPIEATEWVKEYLEEENYELLKLKSRNTRQWWEDEYKKVENLLITKLEKKDVM